MNAIAKRKVRIKLRHGVYFVEYTERKPRQRHLAAQFGADMRTREQVEQWISEQPRLELEDDSDESDKYFFVLGESPKSGVVIRCADRDIAEHELGLMRWSDCNRIARTSRAVTESDVLSWFTSSLPLTKRDSRYN